MENDGLQELKTIVRSRGWKRVGSADIPKALFGLLLEDRPASVMKGIESILNKVSPAKMECEDELWSAVVVYLAHTKPQDKEFVRRLRKGQKSFRKLNKSDGESELLDLLRTIQSPRYPSNDAKGLTKAISVLEKLEDVLGISDTKNDSTTNRATKAFNRFRKNKTYHDGFRLTHHDVPTRDSK